MPTLKQKFFSSLIVIVIAVVIIAFPHFTHAATAGLVPCGGEGEPICKFTDIFILIARVTTWLIRIAGIYAIYRIIDSGFGMVTAMGNEETLTQKKQSISNAVVGFCLTMMAYLFVNFIINFALLRGVPGCTIDIAKPLNYLTIGTKEYDQCRTNYDKQIKSGNIR